MTFRREMGTSTAAGLRQPLVIVDVDAYLRRGAAKQARGRYGEAEEEYRTAIAKAPRNSSAYSNLGTVLQAQGLVREAIDCYTKALDIDPLDGRTHLNVGSAWKAMNKLPEAIRHYQFAIQMFGRNEEHSNLYRVGAEINLAESLLTLGLFKEGWDHYEWRSKHPVLAPLYTGIKQPAWRGEPLDDVRLFIITEQGIGDTLQFCRYLPFLREKAAKVIVLVQDHLKGLLSEIPGITFVCSQDSVVPFDKYCPLMSLPRYLGTTIRSIPAQVPYLFVPLEEAARVSAIEWPQSKLRVGIVWAGGKLNPNDKNRSLEFRQIMHLLHVKDVEYFSFQLGRDEESSLARQQGVRELPLNAGNLAYTAALLSHMDLVISVDTAIAHLAGGMGIPAWVLLPFVPDWRWLLDRKDSLWYPQMHLFRQNSAGDWSSVVEEVRTSLIEKSALKAKDELRSLESGVATARSTSQA